MNDIFKTTEGVSNMNKVIELVKCSLNNNISNDNLKIFRDFIKIDSNKEYRTFGYFFYNSDFYFELLLFLGLHYVELNYNHQNLYSLDDFEIGDLVIYMDETYIFQGVQGVNDKDNVNVVLDTTKNGRNALRHLVPLNRFINNASKITREKRNNHEVDEEILEFLNINEPNYKINKQLLILTEKKSLISWNKQKFF